MHIRESIHQALRCGLAALTAAALAGTPATAGAQERLGSTRGATLQVAITPPPPTNLRASADPLSVRLSWAPAAGVTGYQVFRSNSTSGPWVGITPSVIQDTSYIDRPVLPNTAFVYRVASVVVPAGDAPLRRASAAPINSMTTASSAVPLTAALPGTAGDPVSVTTPASSASVMGISASVAGGQLLVRWNAVVGAHHYFIAQPTRLGCPPNPNYNTEGLSQLVSTTRWGANCVGPVYVHPVYRLARFPSERDTTDWIGPGAPVGSP